VKFGNDVLFLPQSKGPIIGTLPAHEIEQVTVVGVGIQLLRTLNEQKKRDRIKAGEFVSCVPRRQ
jgi:hypothetical protein